MSTDDPSLADAPTEAPERGRLCRAGRGGLRLGRLPAGRSSHPSPRTRLRACRPRGGHGGGRGPVPRRHACGREGEDRHRGHPLREQFEASGRWFVAEARSAERIDKVRRGGATCHGITPPPDDVKGDDALIARADFDKIQRAIVADAIVVPHHRGWPCGPGWARADQVPEVERCGKAGKHPTRPVCGGVDAGFLAKAARGTWVEQALRSTDKGSCRNRNTWACRGRSGARRTWLSLAIDTLKASECPCCGTRRTWPTMRTPGRPVAGRDGRVPAWCRPGGVSGASVEERPRAAGLLAWARLLPEGQQASSPPRSIPTGPRASTNGTCSRSGWTVRRGRRAASSRSRHCCC